MIRFRLLLISGAVIVGGAAVLVFLAWSPKAGDAAGIQFAVTTYDAGVLGKLDQIPVKHAFAFRNAGSAPVAITAVKADCGCTVVDKAALREYAPGESGEVEVLFQIASVGRKSSRILIHTSDRQTPYALVISADYRPKVYAEAVPAVLDMGEIGGRHASREAYVELLAKSPENVVASCTTLGGAVSASIITSAKFKHRTQLGYYSTQFTMRVTPKVSVPGAFTDTIFVSFAPEVCGALAVPVSGRLLPRWICVPNTVILTASDESKLIACTLKVTNADRSKVYVRDIENPLKEWIGVTTASITESEARLELRVIAVPKGTVSGTLSVTVSGDGSAEGCLAIPVTVKGR